MHVLTRNRMLSWADEYGITPANGYPKDDAKLFEYYSAFVYMNEYLQGDVRNLSDLVMSGREFGLDAAGVFINNKLIVDPGDLQDSLNEGKSNRVDVVFLQAKTTEGFDQSMTARFIIQVKCLAEAAVDLNSHIFTGSLHRIATILNAVINNIGRFETSQIPCSLYYVTTASQDGTATSVADPQVVDALRSLNSLGIFQTIKTPEILERTKGLGAEMIDFRAHGHRELFEKHRMTTSPQEVQFKWDRRQNIPAESDCDAASIGVVTAHELLKILSTQGELRPNIFDENVRLYQGEDNPVNKEIFRTLSGERRGQFPYLNNGLTVIASAMETVSDRVTLKDYQVVNGGQTSHEIFRWASSLEDNEERETILTSTWVPLKVIQSPDRSTLRDVTLATNNQTEVTDYEKRANSHKSTEVEEYFSQSGVGGLRYKRQSGAAKMDTVQAKVTETAELTRSVAATAFGQSSMATRSKKEVEERLGDYVWEETRPEGMFYLSAFLSYRIDAFFNRNRSNSISAISIARYHVAMISSVILEPAVEPIFRKNPSKVTSKELRKINLFRDPISVSNLEKRIDEAIELSATIIYNFYQEEISDGKSLLKDQVRGNSVQTELLDYYLSNPVSSR